MMDSVSQYLLTNIARTTLCTAVAALATLLLLSVLRVRSPRVHRTAWLLVIVQGWLLVPLTLTISEPLAEPIKQLPSSTIRLAEAQPAVVYASNQPTAEPSIWRQIGKQIPVAVWLLGVLILVGNYLRRYYGLIAQAPLGRAPESAVWKHEWREALSANKSPANVQFRVTDRVGPLLCYVPFVYLVLVPKLLWSRLQREDRLAILKHELAHYLNGDLWKNLMVRVFALPQWFNPLVWLAVRRFEEAGEWACDEEVLTSSDLSPTDYAETMLRVAGFSLDTPCGAVAASGGVLTRRVTRLLSSSDKEVSKMKNLLVPLLLLAITMGQSIRIESVVAEESVQPISGEVASTVEEKQSARAQAVAMWQAGPYRIEPPDVLDVQVLWKDFDAVVNSEDEFLFSKSNKLQILRPLVQLGNTTGKSNGSETEFGYVSADKNEVLKFQLTDAKVIQHSNGETRVKAKKVQLSCRFVVGPDGNIVFNESTRIFVAGLTIEEAKRAIIAKLGDRYGQLEVLLDVIAINSKVVYVIQQQSSGDTVARIPCHQGTAVLDALANYSEPVENIDQAYVMWTHDGIESQCLEIDLEALRSKDNDAANFELLPGDRIFVKTKPDAKGIEKPSAVPPAPVAPPPAYYGEITLPSKPPRARQVELPIQLIVDTKDNFREIEGLQKGDSVICDLQTTAALIRVLVKNQLAEMLSAPTLVTGVGRPSSFELEGDQLSELVSGLEKISVSVNPIVQEQGLCFSMEVMLTIGGKVTKHHAEPILNVGQAFVSRLHEPQGRPIYLVVTHKAIEDVP